jgi:hypothetical protein
LYPVVLVENEILKNLDFGFMTLYTSSRIIFVLFSEFAYKHSTSIIKSKKSFLYGNLIISDFFKSAFTLYVFNNFFDLLRATMLPSTPYVLNLH